MKLERIGTPYGGWVIPVDMLTESSVCYSVGAGEDISFDLVLINKKNCHVYSFDPTPRAQKHISAVFEAARKGSEMCINNNPKKLYDIPPGIFDKFHYYEYGVYSCDQKMKFYAPENPQYVSHSVVNWGNTNHYFEAECKSIHSIMKELKHDRIDLLKLDIEGAEMDVMDGLTEQGVCPPFLCVEYDEALHQLWSAGAFKCIRLLSARGYVIAHARLWNITFIFKGGSERFILTSGWNLIMMMGQYYLMKMINKIRQIIPTPRITKA